MWLGGWLTLHGPGPGRGGLYVPVGGFTSRWGALRPGGGPNLVCPSTAGFPEGQGWMYASNLHLVLTRQHAEETGDSQKFRAFLSPSCLLSSLRPNPGDRHSCSTWRPEALSPAANAPSTDLITTQDVTSGRCGAELGVQKGCQCQSAVSLRASEHPWCWCRGRWTRMPASYGQDLQTRICKVAPLPGTFFPGQDNDFHVSENASTGHTLRARMRGDSSRHCPKRDKQMFPAAHCGERDNAQTLFRKVPAMWFPQHAWTLVEPEL